MDESVSGEQTGAARWLSVHDDLLRGLTHALSNRVGTIAATAYLVELQPASLATTAATLRAEGDRLETLLLLLRLLPRRTDAAAEPVVPTDACTQALALQAYHPLVGDIPVVVSVEGDQQPAYADPAVLVMALTLAIGAAQRALRGDGGVTLTISSTTDDVHFAARAVRADGGEGRADDATGLDVRAAQWLLAASGGSAFATETGATIVVPTLQAARRAQRR